MCKEKQQSETLSDEAYSFEVIRKAIQFVRCIIIM